MPDRNSNIHVICDGMEWAVAVEGVGRLDERFDFTNALAVATALAAKRRVLLYVHDKQGGIADRVDFSDAPPSSMPFPAPVELENAMNGQEASTSAIHIETKRQR